MYDELFKHMPEEIWAVAVVIGDTICWPLFTQEKKWAEHIARRHNKNGMVGLMVGPLSLGSSMHVNSPLAISGNQASSPSEIGSDLDG